MRELLLRNALRLYHLCDRGIFADSGAQLDGSERIRGRPARSVGTCVVDRSDHDLEFLDMAARSHGSGRLGVFTLAGCTATPYWVMLLMAALCGLGGSNYSSSMANISFIFPMERKGSALSLNAGLGNLGVSSVQFMVPLVISAGIFGWFGGKPQTVFRCKRGALPSRGRFLPWDTSSPLR